MAAADWSTGSLIVTPRVRPATKRPLVMFAPQGGGAASFFLDGSSADKARRARLVRTVADTFGCVCHAGDYGGANTFGNTVVVGALLTAWTAMQTHPMVQAGPAVGVGTSMGGFSLLNFRRTHGSAKLSGMVSLWGGTDLEQAYTNNVGGLAAVIGTAHGVTPPTPLPAGASPLQNVAEVGNLVWRGWYASDDPLILPSTQTAFAAAAADAVAVDAGALGHDDDVLGARWDDIVATIGVLLGVG